MDVARDFRITRLERRTDTDGRRLEVDVWTLADMVGEDWRTLDYSTEDFLALPKPERGRVKDVAAWVPGWFEGTRADDAMQGVSVLVLDFDALEAGDEELLWAKLAGLCWMAHTSASHSAAAPRWRVLLPLSAPVVAAEWRPFWEASVAYFGLEGRLQPDRAARNPSRLYYLPTCTLTEHGQCRMSIRCGSLDVVPPMFGAAVLPAPVQKAPERRKAPKLRFDEDKWVAAARKYVEKMPGAIQGAGGDEATYKAATIPHDFGLSDSDAMSILRDFNARCSPPWTDAELEAKWQHAKKYAKNEFGWRRTASVGGGKFSAEAVRAFVGSNVDPRKW